MYLNTCSCVHDLASFFERTPRVMSSCWSSETLGKSFRPLSFIGFHIVLLPVFQLWPFSEMSITCEQVLKVYNRMWELNISIPTHWLPFLHLECKKLRISRTASFIGCCRRRLCHYIKFQSEPFFDFTIFLACRFSCWRVHACV